MKILSITKILAEAFHRLWQKCTFYRRIEYSSQCGKLWMKKFMRNLKNARQSKWKVIWKIKKESSAGSFCETVDFELNNSAKEWNFRRNELKSFSFFLFWTEFWMNARNFRDFSGIFFRLFVRENQMKMRNIFHGKIWRQFSVYQLMKLLFDQEKLVEIYFKKILGKRSLVKLQNYKLKE